MWCWRTFLPRCSRTFGFGESIKSPRRSPFKEISFSRWIPGSPGPSLAYRFIHEQNSSLSRTSNSIFRADSNENPKFEASAKMSSIGDRTSRPNSSSFALRWFRSNGFPCIFLFFFFSFSSLECHFETSFTRVFSSRPFIMECVTGGISFVSNFA